MERRIYEAAVDGSVESLIMLLEEDALALDRFMVTCYPETPLHIASMLGHVGFVEEVLRRTPKIAGALDFRKASPLHLAAATGYLDIVLKLASVNPEMCSVCDRDGKNPLHVAAIKGHVNVLRELLRVRPQAARILMDRSETILHACVNYSQFEAMKLLVETVNDHEFLNAKDEDGNTILHLAVIDKQLEVVKFLTASPGIEVNAVNAIGLTALDILVQRKFLDVKDWKIGEMLRCSRATGPKGTQLFAASEIEISNEHGDKRKKKLRENGKQDYDWLEKKGKKKLRENGKQDYDWLEKKRGALMVVASLISTMTFQAALNPPGGVWESTSEGHLAGISIMASGSPDFYKAANPPGGVGEGGHLAGRSVMASENPFFYDIFVTSNAIGFVASLSIILLLISGLPFVKRKFFIGMLAVILWIAVTALAVAYIFSSPFLGNVTGTYEFTQTDLKSITSITSVIVLLVWFGLLAILITAHIILFLVRMVKMALKLGKKLMRGCLRSSVRQPLHTV